MTDWTALVARLGIAGLLMALSTAAAFANPFDDALAIVNDPAQLANRAMEAERLFQQSISADPKNADAMYNLGLLQARRGDRNAAERSWNSAVRANGAHHAAKAQLANLRIARGDVAGGTAALEAIIKQERFQPDARNYLAAQALAKNDYDGAIRHARNVLLGDIKNENAYLNAAIAYYRQKLYDQAGLIASSALEKLPNAAALHNLMGLVYLQKDDSKRATDHFVKATTADPSNMDALLNLAALELAYGNFESALKRYDRALKLRPSDALLINSRGVALRGLGRHDEAEQAYMKVLQLMPHSSEAQYNLCVLHHQYTNKYAQARARCGAYAQGLSNGHPKQREMKKRIKAIEATIKAMEAAKKRAATAPQPAPTPPPK